MIVYVRMCVRNLFRKVPGLRGLLGSGVCCRKSRTFVLEVERVGCVLVILRETKIIPYISITYTLPCV